MWPAESLALTVMVFELYVMAHTTVNTQEIPPRHTTEMVTDGISNSIRETRNE